MARGYSGAFGRKVNSPWVWIPLSVLFIAPFVSLRRRPQWLHVDLLVLLAFGVSVAFFNDANISTSVPIASALLLYVLIRALTLGYRRRTRLDADGAGADAAAAALGLPRLAGRRAGVPGRLPDRPRRQLLQRDRRRLLGRDRRRQARRRPEALRHVPLRQLARRHLRPGRLRGLRPVRAGVPVVGQVGRPAGRARRRDRLRPDHDAVPVPGRAGGSAGPGSGSC